MSLIFSALALGVALAMDAFSVSLANSMNDAAMRRRRMAFIAGVFAVFQAVMPFIGWVFVTLLADCFAVIQPFIPWVAMALLIGIGVGMFMDALKPEEDGEHKPLVLSVLLLQGVATSIDALSAGVVFASDGLNLFEVLVSILLIAAVTFLICMGGLLLGKKAGDALSAKAQFFGSFILIAMGLKFLILDIIL